MQHRLFSKKIGQLNLNLCCHLFCASGSCVSRKEKAPHKEYLKCLVSKTFGGAFSMLTQRVHQCEYCGARFNPRPQVKNPRACKKSGCQKKRQRSNELACRSRSYGVRDSEYHRICKAARLACILRVIEIIVKCLTVGTRILGETVAVEAFRALLLNFFVRLGVRKINKFWPDVFLQKYPRV